MTRDIRSRLFAALHTPPYEERLSFEVHAKKDYRGQLEDHIFDHEIDIEEHPTFYQVCALRRLVLGRKRLIPVNDRSDTTVVKDLTAELVKDVRDILDCKKYATWTLHRLDLCLDEERAPPGCLWERLDLYLLNTRLDQSTEDAK